MRFVEIRAFLRALDEVYNPDTIARRKRTHRPLFPKPEQEIKSQPVSSGSKPATVGEIYRAIHPYEEREE